jgi:serine/threonine protein phosphatase 1
MTLAMTEGIHFDEARGPEGIRLYAIGDVHGRLDLLERMHAAIRAEIERDQPADWRILHLGDYVDRGPQSRQVLEFLIAARRGDDRVITLAGNHDLGFLEFLAEPSIDTLFMQNGGLQTAASYGVPFNYQTLDLERFHSELRDAVPPEHSRFIKSCDFSASFGDFFFCHAGIRPRVPLERQNPDDLIWIRNEFLRYAGLHPKVVVHGHTITARPEVLANRVNVDTGACFSGVLTAFTVDGAEKRLIEVEG